RAEHPNSQAPFLVGNKLVTTLPRESSEGNTFRQSFSRLEKYCLICGYVISLRKYSPVVFNLTRGNMWGLMHGCYKLGSCPAGSTRLQLPSWLVSIVQNCHGK